jgi:glycosyltransferase involved in cell wall biosynthesis
MTITDSFEVDPYPGSPKILFVGLGVSSHAHSWVNLLSDAKLNVRMFSVPGGGTPPHQWNVRTYLCDLSSQLPQGLDINIRQSLYPFPEKIELMENEMKKRKNEVEKRAAKLRKNVIYWFFVFVKKVINGAGSCLGMPILYFDYSEYRDLKASDPILNAPKPIFESSDKWLVKVIQDWQPDVIHTLGVFNNQGGEFYFNVRKKYKLQAIGKWVLQLFGGSDLTLVRHNPETVKKILDIFKECDQIVDDNIVSLEYCKTLGFTQKIASIAPVPGTGGIEIQENIIPPSRRERLILWPKAYESKWSKALPVLDAFKLAWNSIKPCKIIMTATMPEVREWLYTLPEEILNSCDIRERISRDEMLSLMQTARVLLSPSLVDGVPNVLYEAMAGGAFPIVSPLDTIKHLVVNRTNVLFARNLYPLDIQDALVSAMTDDELIDAAYWANLDLVRQIASRKKIAENVAAYYQRISVNDHDKVA